MKWGGGVVISSHTLNTETGMTETQADNVIRGLSTCSKRLTSVTTAVTSHGGFIDLLKAFDINDEDCGDVLAAPAGAAASVSATSVLHQTDDAASKRWCF